MPDDGVRLFVYGISASCPRDLLEDKFGKCGRVNDVYNTGKGFAFVTMVSNFDNFFDFLKFPVKRSFDVVT